MAEHWCKEHKTVWFKKGGMKGYAHPITDEEGEPTGAWCNEPKAETPKPETAKIGTDKDAQIWKAVCLKELGECIRSGDVDKTKPSGKLLRQAYYLMLYDGLNIKLGETESENPPSQN